MNHSQKTHFFHKLDKRFFVLFVLFPFSVFAATTFTDIAQSTFRSYIEQSAKYGIISGYGNGMFKPNKTVNFIESLKIIINSGPKKSKVAIEPQAHWSVPFKMFYYQNFASSLVNFSDSQPITRDFAVYLLLRQLDIEFSPNDFSLIPAHFADINENTDFAPYIAFARYAGISDGYGDDTFRAKNLVTRGELTKMAFRTLVENSAQIQKKYDELFVFNSAPQNENTKILPKQSSSQDVDTQIISLSPTEFISLEKVRSLVKNVVFMEANYTYQASEDPSKILPIKSISTGEMWFQAINNFSEYTLYYLNGTPFLSKIWHQSGIADTAAEMIRAINDYRRSKRLPALSPNAKLMEVAQKYAKTMYDYNHFDHKWIDGNNVAYRVEQGGYDYQVVLENIARGQKTVDIAMRDFIASPGHNENLLDTDVNEVGVGFYGNYWVQVFGAQMPTE